MINFRLELLDRKKYGGQHCHRHGDLQWTNAAHGLTGSQKKTSLLTAPVTVWKSFQI